MTEGKQSCLEGVSEPRNSAVCNTQPLSKWRRSGNYECLQVLQVTQKWSWQTSANKQCMATTPPFISFQWGLVARPSPRLASLCVALLQANWSRAAAFCYSFVPCGLVHLLADPRGMNDLSFLPTLNGSLTKTCLAVANGTSCGMLRSFNAWQHSQQLLQLYSYVYASYHMMSDESAVT